MKPPALIVFVLLAFTGCGGNNFEDQAKDRFGATNVLQVDCTESSGVDESGQCRIALNPARPGIDADTPTFLVPYRNGRLVWDENELGVPLQQD